jgi:c-di-GMP-binding flagellar brake protein YcgR
LEPVSAKAKYSDFDSFLELVQKQTSLALRRVQYQSEKILLTEGEKVTTIHFPEDAIVSFRMPLAEQWMEVAMVGGHEGGGLARWLRSMVA